MLNTYGLYMLNIHVLLWQARGPHQILGLFLGRSKYFAINLFINIMYSGVCPWDFPEKCCGTIWLPNLCTSSVVWHETTYNYEWTNARLIVQIKQPRKEIFVWKRCVFKLAYWIYRHMIGLASYYVTEFWPQYSIVHWTIFEHQLNHRWFRFRDIF
jgi:hypothetical protein